MKNEIYIPQVLKQYTGAEISSKSWGAAACVCVCFCNLWGEGSIGIILVFPYELL